MPLSLTAQRSTPTPCGRWRMILSARRAFNFIGEAGAIAGTKTVGTGQAGIGVAITGAGVLVGVVRLDGAAGAGQSSGRDGQASTGQAGRVTVPASTGPAATVRVSTGQAAIARAPAGQAVAGQARAARVVAGQAAIAVEEAAAVAAADKADRPRCDQRRHARRASQSDQRRFSSRPITVMAATRSFIHLRAELPARLVHPACENSRGAQGRAAFAEGAACGTQKFFTAATTALVTVSLRSAESIWSSSSRLMMEPASSRTAGIAVFLKTTSSS